MNVTVTRDQFFPQVAVVGLGYWGKNLVRNFHDIQALGAICDSDQGTLSHYREKYPECRTFSSYENVLKDSTLNAIVISTPAEFHGRQVKQALLSGKDVFVEKPLCMSLQEGRELVSLAREKALILMVGHILWYHPAILKLRDLILTGELGRTQYIYSHRLNIGRIRREENILWSFAPHDISVILGLLGEMPEAVQIQGGNFLHSRNPDVTVSLLSFPSGTKAHIFVSWLHPFKEQKLVVVGDRKMAVFDDVKEENKLLIYPHSISWENHIPVASKSDAQSVLLDSHEPLRAECLHFLECVQTRSTPRTDGEEGLRVLSVLQRLQHALESNLPNPLGKRNYFAHESAFIDEGVEIGEGTSIWQVSHILKGSRIGKNCKIGQNVVVGPNVAIGCSVKIQNNVSVYEGVTLEDYVFCGPSMVFTNVINPRSEIPRMGELKPTLVKRGATLGANSTILCGITIGQYALVGAGAVVTNDVPDYALVVGNPARITGWICACGVKLEVDVGKAHCPTCGKQYEKDQDRMSLFKRPVT